MSGVVHRAGHDANEADRHRWAVAHDLVRLHRDGLQPEDDAVAARVKAGLGQVDDRMRALLFEEAGRLHLTANDRVNLTAYSEQYVLWAEAMVHDGKVQVAENRTLARFAVEVAYAVEHRSKVKTILGQSWPRRWRSVQEANLGTPIQSLNGSDVAEGTRAAFEQKDHLRLLASSTDSFVLREVEPVNQIKPYVDPLLPRTWGWILDPLRPPVAAVRLAASVIEEALGKVPLDILGIELGQTAAAQALAWFRPGSTVHTASILLGDYSVELPVCAAVVLNLPNHRSMELVQYAVQSNRPLTRWDMGEFQDWPDHDPGKHCEGLVEVALDRLADDGVLVVMGDVVSGIHHDAVEIINRDETMSPVELTHSGKAVAFHYTEEPWTLFGCLPATDRLVSAWTRTP
jgi:hypothetical protein